MYCSKCGEQLSKEAIYCPKCGAKDGSYSSTDNSLTPTPESVVLASKLLWASLAIDAILQAIFFIIGIDPDAVDKIKPLLLMFSWAYFSFSILLIIKIKDGKNWVRVLLLIGFIGQIIGHFIESKGPYSEFFDILYLFPTGLDGVAIFLLFNESSGKWFSRKNTFQSPSSR